MPKLRRLSGTDIIRILEKFGFVVVRIRGSHHILRRVVFTQAEDGQGQEETQTINVPVHGSKQLAPGVKALVSRYASLYL